MNSDNSPSNNIKTESLGDKVTNIFSPQIQVFEPFGAHVDPSRTNMSSKQILQLLQSRMNQIPYVLNKVYRDFTEVKSNFTLRAKADGTIINTDFNILFLYYKEEEADGSITTRLAFEYIPPIKKLLSNALPLRYKREIGPFKKGDLLFDYTGQTEEGLPKIGYRANVMFASFLGYTAEDAFVISESFSRRAQVDYMEKLYIPITKKHKYIKNEKGTYFFDQGEFQEKNYLKYIKLDSEINLDSAILNVSEDTVGLYINDIVGLEDGEITEIKVHKINPKPFKEMVHDYKYSPDLIQEVSKLYMNQYDEYLEIKKAYSNLKGQIPEIDKYVNSIFLSFKSNPKLPAKLINEIAESYKLVDKDIDCIIEIDIHQTVPTTLGDKFANCFAGKGVVSMIIPDKYMPIDPEGRPVDVIFNPLGIYGRNNWGMIFETCLATIIRNIEESIENKDLTLEKIIFLNEKFIKRFDMEYYDKVQVLIDNWDLVYEDFKLDVHSKGFYLCADNFPMIPYHEFYNDIIDPYSKLYGTITDFKTYTFTKELWDWVKKERNYNCDAFGPETYDIEDSIAYFGPLYYLKLQHTAYSKYNAIAQARSYNRANGQPAKGRKAEGGIHWGWQSVNVDQGHSDNSYISKELHTFKSACIEEKNNFIKSYTFNGYYNLKEKDIVSPTILNVSHILAMFGLRFANEINTIETSRETEKVRIEVENERITKLGICNLANLADREKMEELSRLYDYDIDKINMEDSKEELKRLLEEEEKQDYIQDIIGY